jgi:aminoglycoside phosphotransferase (APT) family kinase protein
MTSLVAALRGSQVAVVAREANPYAATFHTEILHCRWPDGTERRIFCKRGGRHPDNPHDDRGGVAYEAMVYEHLLSPKALSPVPYWGSFCEADAKTTCLLVGYLEGSVHANDAANQLLALGRAAAWIGRFHARTNEAMTDAAAFRLARFDATHYAQWPARAIEYARGRGRGENWLEPVWRYYQRQVDALISRAPTIIHGDYYPDNTLVREDSVYPIDWGWAAVAPGEIDLASFTEGWPPEVARACAGRYAAERWGVNGDLDFEAALLAARLYLLFR